MREVRSMSETARLVTAAELERLPDDDYRYELVEGRLIRMSPVGFEHGFLVIRLGRLVDEHVRARHLGFVVSEVGFKLRSNPDTVRAPDVAFLRLERLAAERPKGFWTGAPDLAIEVLSPDDRPGDVREKVEEYIHHGVPLVVIVDPDSQTATIHRRGVAPETYSREEQLDLSDVVDGFRCSISAIFD